MTIRRTIGGERLGAGKKMKVDLKSYERSTHDLSYLWRSTMAAGTIVPFMSELGLPGDTFDINLNVDVKTHPTVGPLFGSFKVQADVFMSPIRLYQAWLHNNKLGVGMDMSKVKLPQLFTTANYEPQESPDNQQINPSCLLSYLNIRGLGRTENNEAGVVGRDFNALTHLIYWDVVKNYYANKQEQYGFYIHNATESLIETITSITIGTTQPVTIQEAPAVAPLQILRSSEVRLNYTGTTPLPKQIIFQTNKGNFSAEEMFANIVPVTGYLRLREPTINTSGLWVNNWRYLSDAEAVEVEPALVAYELEAIDRMRNAILAAVNATEAYTYGAGHEAPYGPPLGQEGGYYSKLTAQEGLAVKTYQSDLFNNWMRTEWIDGDNGVNAITAIDTSDGSFTLDTLNLSQKVYEMLNRVAMSGGSYDDWLDVQYTHDRYRRAESPMYMGGLSKELVFQEVIATTLAAGNEFEQALGTLGGKGVMSGKHKGGKINISVDEPSYIMGMISLTPRIDYSQGNKWDVNLMTMDDFHKPALDEIGFQDLITDQMAWWDTAIGDGYVKIFKSAGKQPAWINYMTNVNQVRGNFAIRENEMFMTLNRRYEQGADGSIMDLTTYIDPVKFNHIFAETARDAQNFWVQIGVDITARRKMSAKIMPNL